MQTGRRPARTVQGRAMLWSVSMRQKISYPSGGARVDCNIKTAFRYTLNGSRTQEGVNGVENVVYTQKCQAQAFTQLSPSQPSAVLGLAATINGGGMSQVAGQRPINRRLSYKYKPLEGGHQAGSLRAPALGERSLNLLAIVFLKPFQ